MSFYIGADLGTSAIKLILTDQRRKIIRSASRSYPVSYPKGGWSEQEPSDWWAAFSDGIAELVDGIPTEDILSIGICGQMHGLVILDENDRVIRPAILWDDGRAAEDTARLNEEIGRELLTEYTGNIAFAGFTAPKLLWLRENCRADFDAIAKIMLPKDYINYRLTGVFATEYSDASGTLLLDVKGKCWSERMMEICGIGRTALPSLYESFEPIGKILPEIARALGLSENTVVAAGAADNAGAALGMGVVREGECNISLGTSGTVFIPSKKLRNPPGGSMHFFCHADGGYYLMGCMLSAARCVGWFCDRVLGSTDYASEQDGINRELLGRNDVYFLPYLAGERSPINDTDASGCFIGLRPDTDRSHMLLAIMEGVAFALRDILESARTLGIEVGRSTVCGGGASSPLWMQILASVLGIELVLTKSVEGPSMGGAILAMRAVGEGCTVDGAAEDALKLVQPDAELARRYGEKYKKFKKIYPAVRDTFAEMAR